MVERKETWGCKSPEHAKGCDCRMCNKAVEVCKDCKKLTENHLIPVSIGVKVLGMSKKQLNAPENKRLETKPCHKVNDIKVPQVLFEMKKEYNQGVRFSATAVLKMREKNYFRG